LAAEYLDHLERAGVSEPLVLGGWSFGGAIAFEMAGLLARRGREAGEVILIDSFLGAPLAANLPKAGAVPTNVPVDLAACELAHLRQVQAAHLSALQQYRPRMYRGPVLSLRAVPAQGDPDELWRAVAPDLRVQPLRADHYSIMSKAATNVLLAALSGLRRSPSPLPMSHAQ
jgi:thioesterase domain-containing protein